MQTTFWSCLNQSVTSVEVTGTLYNYSVHECIHVYICSMVVELNSTL